ncbi:unnamed protein product, partial [Heterotrigona itama]
KRRRSKHRLSLQIGTGQANRTDIKISSSRKKPTIHLTVTTPFSPSNQHQKERGLSSPRRKEVALVRCLSGSPVCVPSSNKEGRQRETNLEGGESNRRKKRRRRAQETPLDLSRLPEERSSAGCRCGSPLRFLDDFNPTAILPIESFARLLEERTGERGGWIDTKEAENEEAEGEESGPRSLEDYDPRA